MKYNESELIVKNDLTLRGFEVKRNNPQDETGISDFTCKKHNEIFDIEVKTTGFVRQMDKIISRRKDAHQYIAVVDKDRNIFYFKLVRTSHSKLTNFDIRVLKEKGLKKCTHCKNEWYSDIQPIRCPECLRVLVKKKRTYLLKPNQVARLLNVSEHTIFNYIKEHLIETVELPPITSHKKKRQRVYYRIPSSEVTRIIQNKPL